jgi:hypothetical protein
MINPKLLSPAFPPIPTQDQFGRAMAIFPGMTLLDYATIHIYSANAKEISMAEAVQFATDLIDQLYKVQSETALEQTTKLDIV